jgi:hypothetical protein
MRSGYTISVPVQGYDPQWIHMTFAGPFQTKQEAESRLGAIKSEPDISVNASRAGPQSMLYNLSHELYENQRFPHVKWCHKIKDPTDWPRDITLQMSRARIWDIGAQRWA